MEVKDVNNSVNPLLFNKGAALASAAQALGSGFASLLGQTSLAMDILPSSAPVEAKPEVKTAAADNSREPVRADRETPSAPTDNRENTVAADVEKNVAAPADKKTKNEVSAPSAQNKPAVKKSDKNVPAEAAPLPSPQPTPAAAEPVMPLAAAPVVVENDFAAAVGTPVADGAEAITDILPSSQPAAALPAAEMPQPAAEPAVLPTVQDVLPGTQVTAIIDGREVKLSDFALDDARIAAADSVMIYDEVSGQTVKMSGAEFLQKLKTVAAEQLPAEKNVAAAAPTVPLSADLPVVETAVKTAAAAVAPQVEKQERQSADKVNAAALARSAKPAATAAAQAYTDENRAAQAEVIDAKLADGQKIKVDVQVKEENFSYSASSDLVKDKVGLREILQAAAQDADSDGSALKSPLLQTTAPSAAPQMPQNNTPAFDAAQAARFGAAQAAAPAAAESAEAAAALGARVSSAAGLNSTAMSQAAAGGSEFVNSAKAEAKAKTGDSSFRDIYKGMGKELVDQVKVNITKSAVKGVDKIDITLKPEDLGHIEVKMHISKDGKLQAHIISSRPETMEVLQKEIQSLEKAFNDAGFQTDEGSLSFSFREDSQAGQERNSELRNFIGNVFENESGEEFAGNDNISEWNPASGLNIRV